DVEALRAAFERCAAGHVELALIAGAPGVGKSAVAHELLRSISVRRGLFGVGKFDQLSHGTPHAALSLALRDVARQLLTQPQPVIARWRAELTDALGDNLAALTSLVPEFARLLDVPVPDAAAPVADAQTRLRLALASSLRALASEEHPIVLFLDDLQWAEPPTLLLLEQLVTSQALSHVLLIGAYRDNEVDLDHPLRSTVRRARERGARVSTRALTPLSLQDVEALTADALRPAAAGPGATLALARFLHELTAGNPFFLGVVLRSLHERALIRFDHARGGWSWDLLELRAAELSDDMGVVMAARLHELSPHVRELLELAACIGSDFNLDLLSLSLDRDPVLVADGLLEAARKGLVRPLDSAYKYVSHAAERAGDRQAAQVRYRFLHDRIQQAAYALIPQASLPEVHLKTGRLLLARAVEDEEEDDDTLLLLTQHLNRALPLIDDAAERLRVAGYNLRAGRKAQRACALVLADEYYSCGVDLLPEDAWRRASAIAFELHCGLAEVAAARGTESGFERAHELVVVLKRRAEAPLDRARVSDIEIVLALQQGRYDRCLRAVQEGLEALGYPVPRSGATPIVLRELALVQWRLGRLDLPRYLARPRVRDPAHALAMRFYILMWQSALQIDTTLCPVAVLRLAAESLRREPDDFTTLALAGVSVVLVSGLGAFKQGARLGLLAAELALQGGDPYADSTALAFVGTTVYPWCRPLADATDLLERAHQRARQAAMLPEAIYYAGWDILYRWFQGLPLDDVRALSERYLAEGVEFFSADNDMLAVTVLTDRAARCLRGETRGRFDMSSESWSERAYMTRLRGAENPLYFAIHALLKVELHVLHSDFEGAARWTDEFARYDAPAIHNSPAALYHRFYCGLVAAVRATDAAPAERRALLRIIRRSVRATTRAADIQPDNFRAHELILRAERDRVAGNEHTARAAYDAAIEHARAQGQRMLEALALERAARCCFAARQELIGELYLRAARHAYDRWGARAKLDALTSEFSAYFTRAATAPATSTLVTPSSSRALNESIDLAALLNASRAISGELLLDKLLRRLLVIVLENAGAQRGALLLVRDGALVVEAECDLEAGGVRVLESRPPGARESRTVIDFVARTREELVLDDAAASSDFARDPYILEHRPRALLCTPILHHGELQGLLYLENRLTAAVFTRPRLLLLTQLAAQIAISIENARLYERLDRAHNQAVAADKAKSRFLLTMSHELRTPLNAVIGYADLVEEDLEDEDMDAVQEDLDRIRQGARRLVRTLTSILELSRLESEDVRPTYSPIELAPLLQEVMDECAPLAEQRGDSLELELEGDAPETIWSDVQMTRYALFSVLDNACKYTEGGRVRCRVRARARADVEGVEFAIEDTGIGIPEEAHERVFAAFAQADEGTSRQYEGSGISLAVVRRFVELLAGSVTLVSAPGEGSTFTIWLPRGRE
ncbi:MAG: AAA family ATPase, partial [Myxococcales bacterium]|nr:AAA family ATPase [Myxococcales bacterium]